MNFFRLFGLECSETFFRGRRKYFDVNAAAVQVTLIVVMMMMMKTSTKRSLCQLQDGVFLRLGQLIAMSLVQGGCGFPFLSDATFEYICYGDATNVKVDPNDLPDGTLRTVINKVQYMYVHFYVK